MATYTSDQPLPVRGYGALASRSSYLQSAALLLMRLGWGWVLCVTGWGHLHDVPRMVKRFTNWHVPFPLMSVRISATTELVGGILLMLGLATRLVSVPLVFNFIVAILTAGSLKVKQAVFGGQLLSPDDYDPGRLEGWHAIVDDAAFPFLILSLVLLAFGPGKASLDYLLKRTLFRRHTIRPDDPSLEVFPPLAMSPASPSRPTS